MFFRVAASTNTGTVDLVLMIGKMILKQDLWLCTSSLDLEFLECVRVESNSCKSYTRGILPSFDCGILFKAVCFLLVLFTIGILAFCISISYQILYPNYEPTNGNGSDDWIDVGEYGLAKSKFRPEKNSPSSSEISTTSKSDRFLVQHVLWSKILIIFMLKTEKI